MSAKRVSGEECSPQPNAVAYWVRSKKNPMNLNGEGPWGKWRLQETKPYDEPGFDKEFVPLQTVERDR